MQGLIAMKPNRIKLHFYCRPYLVSIAFYVVAILAYLSQQSVMLAQQTVARDEAKWHVGFELFQMLLEERGLQTFQTLEASLDSPRGSVVVVTGDLRRLRNDVWSRLVQFVGRGGHVLIATDQPRVLMGVGEIHAGPVIATYEEDKYLNFKDCIRIKDIEVLHESMIGVRELLANRTAWLSMPMKPNAANPLRWQVIASLPADCSPAMSSEQPWIVVGTASTQATGIMVVIADTSLLTNAMMWHADNSTFAVRLSELIGKGQKTNLTFVSDGRVLASYKDRMQSPPPLASLPKNDQPAPRIQDLPETDLETKLSIANHVLKSVANSNILNEALANQPRPVNPRAYSMAIITLVALTAVIVLLAYLFRRMPGILKRSLKIPHLSAFTMDSNSKQRGAQFGPAAFILAREFCKECSWSNIDKEWINKATGFQRSSSIPNEKAFREKLEYVRSFEISNLVPRVSETEFLRLGKVIHELRTAMRSPKIDVAK